MTNEKIQSIFHKAVAMCDESGFHADGLIQHVEYNRKKTAYATCYTKYDMFGNISIIKVSKYYAEKANEQQMLNTLVHEVLHAYAPREHHGGRWARAAKIMSEKYNLEITRCADYKDENGESILNSESVAKYILKCPTCGKEFKWARMCKYVRNPSNYYCPICGQENGRLVRIK